MMGGKTEALVPRSSRLMRRRGRVERDRGSAIWPQVLVGFVLIATLFANSQDASAGGRVSATDALLVGVGVLALLRLLTFHTSDFFVLYGRLLVPLSSWAVVFLVYVLVIPDYDLQYAVNLFALGYLLVPLVLLTTPHLPSRVDVMALMVLVSGAVFLAFALTESAGANYRRAAAGSFTNPNHTSAFGCLFILACMFLVRRWLLARVLLVMLTVLVLSQTFSFGSMLALACASATGFLLAVTGVRRRLYALGLVLLAFVLVWALSEWLTSHIPRLAGGTGELTKSRDSRWFVYQEVVNMFLDRPWGRGFGAVRAALPIDVHSDHLNFLAAFGLLGPLVVLLMLAVLWSLGGVATRPIVVFLGVGAFTHDSFSWRYQWLFLAIALVSDRVHGNSDHSIGRGQIGSVNSAAIAREPTVASG